MKKSAAERKLRRRRSSEKRNRPKKEVHPGRNLEIGNDQTRIDTLSSHPYPQDHRAPHASRQTGAPRGDILFPDLSANEE